MRYFLILCILLLAGCKASEDSSSGQACWYDVTYKATFVSQWSAISHPNAFPSNASFGDLVGAVHSSDVTFWQEGQYASVGVQVLAESGYPYSSFYTEIAAAITAKTALQFTSPQALTFNQTGTSFTFAPTNAFPIITLLSKISPSPDWFMGVNSLNLCESGKWVETKTVDLQPFDAGTDSGTDFSSSNQVTSPQGLITEITTGIFSNNGAVAPLGQITFTLQ